MPGTRGISLPVHKLPPVLKLPPEIRDQIWRNVVVKDGDVVLHDRMRQDELPESNFRSANSMEIHRTDDGPLPSSRLAVAFTCRQLYREVTPIYYRDNTFRPGESWYDFTYREVIESFADAIGPTNAGNITDLCFFACWYIFGETLSLLPGLKRLHFVRSWIRDWDRRVTIVAQRLTSLVIIYDGEVWGPEKWRLYPAEDCRYPAGGPG